MSRHVSGAVKLAGLGPALRLPVARMVATEKMPYFGGGIAELVPYEIPGTGKIMVSESSVLCYDPELLGQWTGAEAGAVITHEYMHIFLRHTQRFQELVKRGLATLCQEDHEDFNVAADAEINDNLGDAGLPLPNIDGSPPTTPHTLGCPDHLTAEQYYASIKEKKQRGAGPQPPPSWGCGSGAGNPQPEEPEPKEAAKLGHDEVSQDVSRRAAAERVLERQRTRGDVPAGILAAAEGEVPSAVIDWQTQLRTAVLDAAAFINGSGDYTWTVRNRNQGALEHLYGEDAPVLPGEHEPLAKVSVVIDTSGSVSDDDLLNMAGETKAILDCLGGITVTFLACDAAVHALVEVRTVEEVLANLKGRGGTDFRPAFAALDKQTQKPDVIVFMTDGEGPAPDRAPTYAKTIWLITPGGSPPAEWGSAIILPERAA